MSDVKEHPAQSAHPYSLRPERPDRVEPPFLSLQPPVPPTAPRPAAREFSFQTPQKPASAAITSWRSPGPVRPPLDVIRREVARGLRYAHLRSNLNTTEMIQIASLAQATREVLEERKLIAAQEVERRQAVAAQRLSKEYSSKGMGVSFNQADTDKYQHKSDFVIDCENRIQLCKAACCKLHFALSRQDVEEGIVRWDFGNPYRIAQGADSYCVHLDRERKCCSIYEARPLTCRTYDCRKDDRIWVDFDRRIPNPLLDDPAWPRNARDAEVTETPADPGGPPAAARCETSPPNGIVQSLVARPVFYRFRGWYVSAYGAFLSLGFGLGILYWVASIGFRFRQALPPLYFVAGLVLVVFLGSRFLVELENLVAVRLGQATVAARGHTFYGGLLGGLLSTAALAWTQPQEALLYADSAAAALGLGYALGKIGCLASGCCIGRPTSGRFAVRYAHEMSKAVAFYDLKETPLAPLQLYEAALGLGLFVLFSLLPGGFYGQGRAIGLFLIFLAVGRSLLLPFRFRFTDERAAPLFGSLIHLGLVAAGILLLAKGAPATRVAPKTAAPPSLLGILFISCAVSIMVFYLFGVHRTETRTKDGAS